MAKMESKKCNKLYMNTETYKYKPSDKQLKKFRSYVAAVGYKVTKAWGNENGLYAQIKGHCTNSEGRFSKAVSGGTIVMLSVADFDNQLILHDEPSFQFPKYVDVKEMNTYNNPFMVLTFFIDALCIEWTKEEIEKILSFDFELQHSTHFINKEITLVKLNVNSQIIWCICNAGKGTLKAYQTFQEFIINILYD